MNKTIQEYLINEEVRDESNIVRDELYDLCSNNIQIQHFKKSIENNELKGENWIDFEREISQVIKGIEYCRICYKKKMKKGTSVVQPKDNLLFNIGYNFLNRIKDKYKYKYKYKFNLEFDINKFHEDDYSNKVVDFLNEELNNLI